MNYLEFHAAQQLTLYALSIYLSIIPVIYLIVPHTPSCSALPLHFLTSFAISRPSSSGSGKRKRGSRSSGIATIRSSARTSLYGLVAAACVLTQLRLEISWNSWRVGDILKLAFAHVCSKMQSRHS